MASLASVLSTISLTASPSGNFLNSAFRAWYWSPSTSVSTATANGASSGR